MLTERQRGGPGRGPVFASVAVHVLVSWAPGSERPSSIRRRSSSRPSRSSWSRRLPASRGDFNPQPEPPPEVEVETPDPPPRQPEELPPLPLEEEPPPDATPPPEQRRPEPEPRPPPPQPTPAPTPPPPGRRRRLPPPTTPDPTPSPSRGWTSRSAWRGSGGIIRSTTTTSRRRWPAASAGRSGGIWQQVVRFSIRRDGTIDAAETATVESSGNLVFDLTAKGRWSAPEAGCAPSRRPPRGDPPHPVPLPPRRAGGMSHRSEPSMIHRRSRRVQIQTSGPPPSPQQERLRRRHIRGRRPSGGPEGPWVLLLLLAAGAPLGAQQQDNRSRRGVGSSNRPSPSPLWR